MPRTSSDNLTQDNLIILGLKQTPTQLNLNGILTDRELRDLRINLDRECLYCSQRTELVPGRNAIPVETITKLALYLSGPLVQSIYPGSTLYRELQLKTLVSCLALLHYNQVRKLHPESWSQLQENIANRFNDVVNQHGEHDDLTLDKSRHFSSLYLIRLASLWASAFGRSEPLFRSLISPVFQLVFAGYSIAIGQNANLSAISKGCDEILRLWQSPQTEYLGLLGFQELVRLATTIRFINDSDAGGEKFIDVDALKSIMAKLSGTIRDVFDSSPGVTSGHLRDVLITLTGGSPRFNRGYYFYGLLDCAVQLGRHLHPKDIPAELRATKESLLSISGDSLFRWKAIELHLAYQPQRIESIRDLKRYLGQRNPLMGREVEVVWDILEQEENPGLGPKRSSCTESPNPEEIYSGSTPISTASTTNDERQQWDEAPFNRWSIIEPTGSSSVFRKKETSYKKAGLSSDCSSVWLYSDRSVVVYSLRVPQAANKDLCVESFEKIFIVDPPIWDVALSKNYLVVSTLHNVLVFRHSRNPHESPLEAFPSEGYLLGGLAVQETDVQLTILVGKSRKNTDSTTIGLITIHSCSLVNSSDGPVREKLPFEKPQTIAIPGQDYPKIISFGQDGKTISCITSKLNTVLIWVAEGELSSSITPFVISNRYTPETNVNGVTSSSIFTSTFSGKMYVITTTSPSSERHKNMGEWSYSSPIGKPSENLPPDTTHNFEQFRKNQSLVAGAVSRQCNIFAVLERTGNIFLLPLTGHSRGGIYSEVEKPIKLESALYKQDRPSPLCLRFDPMGTRLYAVDAKGKIIVTTFGEG